MELNKKFNVGQRVEIIYNDYSKIKSNTGGRPRIRNKRNGTIKGVYNDFILVNFKNFKECFSHKDIAVGEVRIRNER